MNDKQKIIYKEIQAVKYTDLKIGNDFQKWLKTCEYIYTQLDTINKEDRKNYLVAAYKIIHKAVEEANNVGYSAEINVLPAETVVVLVTDYLEKLSRDICNSLLKFYKFLIIRKLFSNKAFTKLVIQFYLDGTHIGGREQRGWSNDEINTIVKFATSNLDVIVEYGTKAIFLDTNGYIMIKDPKDLDTLGKNIHASFSMWQMQKKMDQAEKEYKEKQFEKAIEEGVKSFLEESKEDDYAKVPPFSIEKNQCIDKCIRKVWKDKWDGREVCACPVQKQGWMGPYQEIERCNDEECES